MRLEGAPLLVPALAFVAAVAAVVELGFRGVPIALLAGGIAHLAAGAWSEGGRAIVWAAVLAGAALGLIDSEDPNWHRPLRLERPVEIIGRVDGGWRRTTYGWRAGIRVEQVAQDGTSIRPGTSARLFLSGTLPPPKAPRLRLHGYLRRSTRVVNDARRRRPDWRIAIKSRRLMKEELDTESFRWSALTSVLREGVSEALDRQPASTSTMLRALLLGDSSRLPAPQLLAMRRVGLAHLLAVSGLHLGMAMGFTWLVFLFLPPAWRLLPIAAVLAVYVALVGPRPSVVRAAVMATVMIVTLLVERRPSAGNAWALAVIGMVSFDCVLIRDVGFQLTSAATLGLVTIARPLAERWSGSLPSQLAAPLAASLTAHLATLPWSLSMFHLWSPAAVALNLLAVPWTAVTLGCGALAVICGFLPVGGVAIGQILWLLVELLIVPFHWLEDLPPGPMSGIPVSLSWWASISISLFLMASLWTGRRWLVLGCLGVGMLIAFLPDSRTDSELVMIDVGQGDAVLLRGGGRSVLVDGGGWSNPGVAQAALLPVLTDLGIRKLDGIVMTHPDRDHCGGLLELSHLIPIENLWTAPAWEQQCYRELVRRPSIRLRPLWAGERVLVGSWTIDVLHPAAGSRGGGNDRSLVLRASSGSFRTLLTGDVTVAVEARLLEQGRDLAASVLKVAHHGSESSSSRALVEEISPRVALISAGEGNRYGHPSTTVLDRLSDLGIEVWRTDLGGRIDVRIGAGGAYDIRQPFVEARSAGLP